MSVNDTWMPLYIGDYLADTMHLNASQHGAYVLLLMHYWRNGPLVDDDAQLAAIARCDAKLWRSVGPVVRTFFRLVDGFLHQKRMDQERNKWSSISDKRREAGRAGAEAKWKPNGGHPPPDPKPSRMANAISPPVDNDGKRIANAIPLPSSLPSEKWQMPSVCQPFATPPVPSKNLNSLSFQEFVSPRESSEAPTMRDIGAERRVAGIVRELRLALKTRQPPRSPDRDEQLADLAGSVVIPPKPKPQEPIRSVAQQLAILEGRVPEAVLA